MRDLYVYYKVPDAHAPALAPRVLAMQAQLQAEHGLACQLKRRPASDGGLQTWMEVYPATAAGFEAALQGAVLQSGITDQISGARHTEVFMDLTTCA